MSALTAHGLKWDGPVIYQSSESARYEHALHQLSAAGWLFRCRCSRATLSHQGTCGQECESRDVTLDEPHSLRVRFDATGDHYFEDRFLGPQQIDPGSAPRDFIVKRRDGLYAYQLAAAVDDAQPQFTAVVRGADLLDSTYRQLWLQQLLDLESPQYAHVTVVNDGLGNKLSKQTGAPALVTEHAAQNLRTALSHLKQAAPPDTARRVAEILDFATEHWSFPSPH
jgi:glutamyl-Q tRNA(Asp) synthetase